jgi:hypothetical protein
VKDAFVGGGSSSSYRSDGAESDFTQRERGNTTISPPPRSVLKLAIVGKGNDKVSPQKLVDLLEVDKIRTMVMHATVIEVMVMMMMTIVIIMMTIMIIIVITMVIS